ncbi:hypothetical protein O0L34_g162 [Tuta absoluta]|nr:hypothetical protein O0L34_g162 [Tuta absoluta]
MAGSSFGRGGSLSKFRLSRLGKKLQISDDPRTLQALPKEVPERTWAEVFQKEENELICFDMREEILEAALEIVHESYMEKQTALFTVHCAAVAIRKLIDWHFYRHDPGEEPSAYPPCYIPKRLESWTPDPLPETSVKDSFSLRQLRVAEHPPEEVQPSRLLSAWSIEPPVVVNPIPEEFWFPGRVNLTTDYIGIDGVRKRHVMSEDPKRKRPDVELIGGDSEWNFVENPSFSSSGTTSKIEAPESEILQKVTDYPGEASINTFESKHSSLKLTTPVDGSLQGAGDSTLDNLEAKKRSRKSKGLLKSISMSMKGRLPPLVAESMSHVSTISDCRLRNLRLDTHYEITSEKVESHTTKIKPNMKKKKGPL